MEPEVETEVGGSGLPFRMAPGQRFAGKYLVERVLGTGAMGVVVAALHEQLGQTVAIKLLSVPKDLQPDAIGRFFREARAAAALRSEHTARVVDVGSDELGRHFIVMEHLEGEDLGAVLKAAAPRSLTTSVGYVLHACEAIAEAHALGIVHRDLKPENLFLSRRMDGYPLVKVLDFGVSKMLEASVVRRAGDDPAVSVSGSLVGTPLYMSPEQIRTPSTVDGRSDVWSLGVILYELVTGRQPFGGETVADVIASILVDAPVAPSALRADVPDQLSRVILACLEKDVDRRFGNVGILAEGLRPWAPRWARDSAVRAARIAGERRLGLDDTGPYKTAGRDTGPAELPAVPSAAPGPSAASATGADTRRPVSAVTMEMKSEPGPLGVIPVAAGTVSSSSRAGASTFRAARVRTRHLGWMALGFGSAVALLVTLLNVVPRAARSPGARLPELVEGTSGASPSTPKPLAAPTPTPAPTPKPLAAPGVSPAVASDPTPLDSGPRRSDARSTVLPAAAAELVGERAPTTAVVAKPHRLREASSDPRPRSPGTGPSVGPRPATRQLADPLGSRR